MKIKDFFKGLFARRTKPAIVNLEFPTQWETMSLADFKEVCKILTLPGIGRDRALFLCFCQLAHIRPDNPNLYDPRLLHGKMPFIIDGQTHIIGAEALSEATNQISYIYDSIGLPPCPFDGIDRKLYSTSFKVFFTVDSLLLRSAAENNGAYMKEAAKILTGGRKRKLQPWERTAFTIWWNGVKETLMQMYPYVLKKDENFTTSKTQAQILQDLLSVMNDNRPQENAKILDTDVHSVLHALNKIYEDANKKLPR